MKLSDSAFRNVTLLIIFLTIIGFTVFVTLWDGVQASDNGHRLSREQQIELMKECKEDGKRIVGPNSTALAVIAAAFFEYRAREGY